MKIAFFQFCPLWGQPQYNRNAIIAVVEKLQVGEVDLLVLPELSLSGYLFSSPQELLPYTHTANDNFFNPLQELCNRKHLSLVVGFAERVENETAKLQPTLYNSAILFQPHGGDPAVYRKNHLFNCEKLLFSPGNLGFPTFDVAGVKVGLLICFDHMFPEATRTLALQGVQVVCHLCNLVLPGYAQITTRARALENRLFWILANRYGEEGALTYSGRSWIVSPYGEVLAEALPAEDTLQIIEIDPNQTVDKKLADHNDLFDDRRVDTYTL